MRLRIDIRPIIERSLRDAIIEEKRRKIAKALDKDSGSS